MNKTYILDTSVFVANPKVIDTYENTKIVVPIAVLEELDKLKKAPSDVGRAARLSIKKLDELTQDSDLTKGIILERGNSLRIEASSFLIYGEDKSYGDSKILSCAIHLKNTSPADTIVLVSRDINLRVKARACGLSAEDYQTEVVTDDLYAGFRTVPNSKLGKKLLDNGHLELGDFDQPLYPNEFVLFTDSKGNGLSVGRKLATEIKLVTDKAPWGLKVRGKEQLFALELLLDPEVPLVTLSGIAGGGKTLCSLAASLELVINQRRYDNLTIYRPIQPVGADIGFLPGSAEEKIAPFYGSINDAFSLLLSDKSRRKDGWKNILFQYLDSGVISQEAIAFIRGRSIHNTLVYIDEAQNLSREEVKTILTRVGENTKIIFAGDIQQIDTPHLDAMNNGLTYLIERFKEYDLAGHVSLNKGERSKLSSLAAQIL